ncbi:DctP family TRAP transporter solute-binding subunit [Bacillus sp. FJAT-45350]|uniref:DctP family TRAP transporter solute-binding subunit n=1 Tax=Bacillus sp. FJAT-45350 TaxID=2011014 RepID=UPI000BB987A7|nr:DctP family TRAP transporter solute-binding subunit [Bacillus sp. FJAT-45350]
MKGFIAILSFLFIGIITAFYIGFGFDVKTTPQAVDKEIEGLNEKYVLRFSHVVADNTPKGLAASLFAQLVKEKTDGWVDIQIFSNGVLFNAQEEFDALKRNEVHLIAPAFSEIAVHNANWFVMDLPFLFRDEKEVKEAFDGEIGQLLFESIGRQGYKGIAYWENSFKHITNNIRPIRSTEDLSEVTVRVMPSDALMDTYRTIGARPRVYAFNEVYEALSDGRVDGTENTPSNIYSKGLYQQQKYMTISNHNYLGYAVLMNEHLWERLPVEHQSSIMEAMEEVNDWLRVYAIDHNEERLNRIKNTGLIEINELAQVEKEHWRNQLESVYDKYSELIHPDIMEQVYKLHGKKSE